MPKKKNLKTTNEEKKKAIHNKSSTGDRAKINVQKQTSIIK